jgi:hypothetical protein
MPPTETSRIARQISVVSRNFLIRHTNGPVLIDNMDDWPARKALLTRSLIVLEPRGAKRPTFSQITTFGRDVLCFILAEYAEALVRAGYLEEMPRRFVEVLPPIDPVIEAKANLVQAVYDRLGEIAEGR